MLLTNSRCVLLAPCLLCRGLSRRLANWLAITYQRRLRKLSNRRRRRRLRNESSGQPGTSTSHPFVPGGSPGIQHAWISSCSPLATPEHRRKQLHPPTRNVEVPVPEASHVVEGRFHPDATTHTVPTLLHSRHVIILTHSAHSTNSTNTVTSGMCKARAKTGRQRPPAPLPTQQHLSRQERAVPHNLITSNKSQDKFPAYRTQFPFGGSPEHQEELKPQGFPPVSPNRQFPPDRPNPPDNKPSQHFCSFSTRSREGVATHQIRLHGLRRVPAEDTWQLTEQQWPQRSSQECTASQKQTSDSTGSGVNEDCEEDPNSLLHTLLPQPYYHTISRIKSKNLLETAEEGVFLVRPSTRSKNPLTLSLRHHTRIYNINIRLRQDGLFALGSENPKEMTFKSVDEIVTVFQRRPIKLKNGEHALLTTSPPKVVSRMHQTSQSCSGSGGDGCHRGTGQH